ncbi:Uncharacterized protein C31G5.21 [Beauveria bassiana]|uniref:Uncharacterized protein C31G5.21 n=1 Tax=Beauveria bassiana TaxID=176275 RepID=A0A2N6NNJ3_BEABA|nr:Uncharacterized protein C31G5.21 [Beauveria bassiana]
MPSDDYALSGGGGGALKLKGAKVDTKKKKRRAKTDLEKNLATGEGASPSKELVKKKRKEGEEEDGQAAEDRRQVEEEDDVAPVQKTESERQYEEAKKKRLLKMAEKSGSRPELLKTHKERVEQLNTYLSKLSEHHDMPKIGPG